MALVSIDRLSPLQSCTVESLVCTTANACTGEEGLDGVGVSDREAGGFAGPAQGS